MTTDKKPWFIVNKKHGAKYVSKANGYRENEYATEHDARAALNALPFGSAYGVAPMTDAEFVCRAESLARRAAK